MFPVSEADLTFEMIFFEITEQDAKFYWLVDCDR